jgi:hypothetical protein
MFLRQNMPCSWNKARQEWIHPALSFVRVITRSGHSYSPYLRAAFGAS